MLSLELKRLIMEQETLFLSCGNSPRAIKAHPGAIKSHLRVVETFFESEFSHWSPGDSPWNCRDSL
jgi:hypothetical protein